MRRLSIPSLPRIFWVVGALLLAMDLGLMALYLGWKLEWVHDVAFDLGHDRGASEVVQYAKMLWISMCGGWMAWRTRQPVFVALSALFLGLLIDDAGMIHERLGVRLGEFFHFPEVAGLRPHDFGEIASVALWVGPLFLVGIAAYRRSNPAAQRTAWGALGALVALATFGVGADVLHQVLTSMFDVNGLHSFLTVVEEGGEMVVMTGIAACAIALVANYPEQPALPVGGDGQDPGVPTSWPPSITNRPPVTNDDALEAR